MISTTTTKLRVIVIKEEEEEEEEEISLKNDLFVVLLCYSSTFAIKGQIHDEMKRQNAYKKIKENNV
jgi:hypothetical protein